MPFPPRELSPNDTSVSWHEKAKIKAVYRQSCWTDATNAKREYEAQGVTFPLKPPLTMILTFVLPNLKKTHDWDNLLAAFKTGLDAIGPEFVRRNRVSQETVAFGAGAGLITNDSIQVITRLGLEVEMGPKPAVRVRLETTG